MPDPTRPDPAAIRRAPATAAAWYTGHAAGVGLRPERWRGRDRAIAGEQQARDGLAVLGPLLDLVEIAMIGEQRLVRLFVGPGHEAVRSTISRLCRCGGIVMAKV
jgi:hypothetical protein